MAAFDIHSPQQMGAVVRRMTNFSNAIPGHIAEAGKAWYPEAHDVAMKAGKEFGISTRTSAGMMASLSAGTEWEANKSAFHDLLRMTPEHKQMVYRSMSRPNRTAGVKSMLEEHYPGLTVSTDRNILRALSIHGGEDPEEALNRRTAPKYNSFYRNILNPGGSEVTIDYRAFDMTSNAMNPSRKYNRGLDKAELLRPGRGPYRRDLSRFERISDVYKSVAESSEHGFTIPNQAQAALWIAGKGIETSLPTKKGEVRKTGMKREGQPYMTGSGDPIDYGLLHINWGQMGGHRG